MKGTKKLLSGMKAKKILLYKPLIEWFLYDISFSTNNIKDKMFFQAAEY